jgi:hypothetical protein
MAALLAQAVRDAVAQRSVHVVSQLRRGSQTRSFQEDVAIDRGRQVIRLGAIRAEVIQIHHRAYISGNSAAMVTYFGLPKAERSRLAGRWLALTPADPGYQSAVTDVTIGSDIKDMVPTAPLSRTATTLDGQPVIAITGSPPPGEHPPAAARETLFLSEGRQPLPLRETGTAPGDISETATLSRWGQPLSLPVPRRAIPISAVSHG